MSTPARSHTPERWLVALLTLGALALRLIQLGRDSLWYDETVSVYLAGRPPAELIAHTARDIHPPLYYLCLRGWLLLTSYPTGHADPTGFRLEFMAAFLSLIFGVLLVPLTWQLARRLRLGQPTATLAALLLAVSPLGIWYSQEVRMYTLGASLGVLCLLAAIPFLNDHASARRRVHAALALVLAEAAGMYTLYYFAFLLISLNLLMLTRLITRRASTRAAVEPRPSAASGQPLLLWLAAQLGALLLYLPWLSVAWRQATDPPVPPWRAVPHLLDVLVESWTALIFGQSASAARFWPLLLLALVLLGLGLRTARPRRSVALLLSAGLLPPLLILLASLWTPLYHVRYLATYAPAWSILLALGLTALGRWRRPAGTLITLAALVLLLMGSALSLRAFWTDPFYRADDLRAATHELAQRWRPGDAILVNAGYTYPGLLTYWPLAVSWQGRLSDYTPEIGAQAAASGGALIVQTGHIDGDAGLGWGDPRSDFYALPASTARLLLRDLSVTTDRLWHIRLYDTVNDPQGVLRQDLNDLWTLVDDRVYSGEASLRVQGWQGMRATVSSSLPPAFATFDNWLVLAVPPDALPVQAEAGMVLAVPRVQWTRSTPQPGARVALSLRLADATGAVWAARDEPLGGNQLDLVTASLLMQPLGLPIPAGTAPGVYQLTLVVYDPVTGQPLTATLPDNTTTTQVTLGAVTINRPAHVPVSQPAVADFGALHLVTADTPATALRAGDSVPLTFTWQAASGDAPPSLVVVVQALNAAGEVVASLEEEPLAGRYPTTQWQPDELVNDRHTLTLPTDLPPGPYQIVVGAYRTADRQRLALRHGLFGPRDQISFVVRTITVQ